MVLFRVDCLFYYPLYYFEFWVLRFGARLGRGGGEGVRLVVWGVTLFSQFIISKVWFVRIGEWAGSP